MAEVLDQREIDALLDSVAAESSDASGAASVIAPGAGLRPTPKYDFKRPHRVSADQIRALSAIHEIFARNLSVSLSGLLRALIDVRVINVEQLTYGEFTHSLPNPTGFMILQAPPLEGQMCLEFSPLIIYPFIDRLLGGSAQATFVPPRPLTSIEWRLLMRIADRALEHLSEVWRNIVDARFSVVQNESNPQLVHIVAPTEVVVLITFEIRLGQNAGTMSLCIPYNIIDSVLSHLTTQSWFYKPKPATETHRKRIVRNLSKTTIPLTVFLGQTSIRLSELRGLRAGDLLPLDKPINDELMVQIAGRNKFAGRPGQLRGRRAVRLMRRAEGDERL